MINEFLNKLLEKNANFIGPDKDYYAVLDYTLLCNEKNTFLLKKVNMDEYYIACNIKATAKEIQWDKLYNIIGDVHNMNFVMNEYKTVVINETLDLNVETVIDYINCNPVDNRILANLLSDNLTNIQQYAISLMIEAQNKGIVDVYLENNNMMILFGNLLYGTEDIFQSVCNYLKEQSKYSLYDIEKMNSNSTNIDSKLIYKIFIEAVVKRNNPEMFRPINDEDTIRMLSNEEALATAIMFTAINDNDFSFSDSSCNDFYNDFFYIKNEKALVYDFDEAVEILSNKPEVLNNIIISNNFKDSKNFNIELLSNFIKREVTVYDNKLDYNISEER